MVDVRPFQGWRIICIEVNAPLGVSLPKGVVLKGSLWTEDGTNLQGRMVYNKNHNEISLTNVMLTFLASFTLGRLSGTGESSMPQKQMHFLSGHV